jgi:hypothetical protein
MGGGDLNMKKSWHPLLLKNQERVWLEEKKSVSHSSSSLEFKILPMPLTARREEETRPITQGERRGKATSGTPAPTGRTNGEKTDGKVRMDVCNSRHRECSECERSGRLPLRQETG